MKPKITNWSNYYDKVKNNSPRITLFKAIKILEKNHPRKNQQTAVDLGCGTGRDTVELLNSGIRVLAIDAEKEAIERLLRKLDQNYRHLLKTQIISFENLNLNQNFDLINASFCLPFYKPESFNKLWQNIIKHIRKGGIFSGQFFGPNDEWTMYNNMTFHSKKEIEKLFFDFYFEYFKEEEENKTTAIGDQKHWHIFHVVARKN